ncbi:hypothetical protein COO60DRAFT_1484576 [Scenedesmus sp. NREL 46B-D3]|nr:hypothetical protein COO60DRAFT_1484576 [Scenedesmus sp. NREL 46B-D3]
MSQMAMVTITILAMPTLGTSFTKALQRIAGVMAGGWLFYVLFAACQAWWFLTLCLAAWAFLLVSLSFLLTGQQYLSPAALVTAFVAVRVCSGGTAQAELLADTGELLARRCTCWGCCLVCGRRCYVPTVGSSGLDDSAVLTAIFSASQVRSGQCGIRHCVYASSVTMQTHWFVTLSQSELAVRLCVLVTARAGTVPCMASACCCVWWLPSNASFVCLASCLSCCAVCVVQVLRTLLIILEEFGGVPVGMRPLPAHLVTAGQRELVKPLAHHAVAALKDLSSSLGPSGPAASVVDSSNLSAFANSLQQLIAATLENHCNHATAASSSSDVATGPAAVAAGAGSKWRRAAAAATGSSVLHGRKADQIAAAFGKLLTDAVTSEEAQTARWCTMLVLSRQLGKSLVGLTQSLNALLPLLPGAPQGQVSSQVVKVDGVAAV